MLIYNGSATTNSLVIVVIIQLSNHTNLNVLLLILDNTYSFPYLCDVVMKFGLVLLNLAVTYDFGSIFWIESLSGVLNLEPLAHFISKSHRLS